MLWGGASEPFTGRFKAGIRKLSKKQSSSEQEALSKATSQNPALSGQYLSHATPPYYPHIRLI